MITTYKLLSDRLKGECHIDEVYLNLLSTDASLYKVKPSAIVYPFDENDVVMTMKFAAKHKIPVHPRGTGSGLCGSAVGKGIILDFTKFMNKLIEINISEMSFTCEPGYKYGELEKELSDSDYFFPPAPSSGEYATFGGMYGTNAGGAYSVKYGNVADYIIDADIVFSDGTTSSIKKISTDDITNLPENLKELYKILSNNVDLINSSYPPVPCNVCGYDLRQSIMNNSLYLGKLIGGSEGTLAIVTKLKFRLVPKKNYNALIVAYFNNIVDSAKASQLALKLEPASIEIMDKSLLNIAAENSIELAKALPEEYDNILMIEFESDNINDVKAEADTCINKIKQKNLSTNISLAISNEEKNTFWAIRKAAVPILYLIKGAKKIIPLIEDAAVPVDNLVHYFNGLYTILYKYNVQFVLYGHIAKGLIHARPLLDMKDKNDISLLKPIADDVFNLVADLQGTVSGEHGDGRIRSSYIPLQYKSIYPLFLEVKSLLDPYNILNPDIITNSEKNEISHNLRYGEAYQPLKIEESGILWGSDINSEIEKCHGCSKCTTVTTATRMCPMYKIKRDEKSSPKAKANILRALISGDIKNKQIYSKKLQEVINRCINCGSCALECPSRVNIPKLSIHAKSLFIRRHGVPLKTHIQINFEFFGRYASKIPFIINPLTKLKIIRFIAEKTAGISQKRSFIKFANSPKQIDYKNINLKTNSKGTILLFGGCYATYSRPEIISSMIKILEHIGYDIIFPKQHCCGVPHLSKGDVKGIKKKIETNLSSWSDTIDKIDYIVTGCSSCALALTKEWEYVTRDSSIDKVKSKTKYISEIIEMYIEKFDLKKINTKVAYHMPCHMRSIQGSKSTANLLKQLRSAQILNTNCCGMGGSWGMSVQNYDESKDIAGNMIHSLMLSDAQTAITDCPTCEMQLKHLQNLPVVNPAEIFAKLINI